MIVGNSYNKQTSYFELYTQAAMALKAARCGAQNNMIIHPGQHRGAALRCSALRPRGSVSAPREAGCAAPRSCRPEAVLGINISAWVCLCELA